MTKWWERIYAASPVWGQQLAINAFGWYWKRRRLGEEFQRLTREYIERETWPADRLRDYVQVQLREQVLRAWHEVPYYRERFKAHGITEEFLRRLTVADLPRLPLLERMRMRTQPELLLTATARRERPKAFPSSGTTGTPTRIYWSPLTHQHNMAVREARSFRWAGVSLRDVRAVVGAKAIVPRADDHPPFWRYNRFEKQLYLSLYHISPKNTPDYVSALNRFRPDVLEGLGSGLYFLARFIRDAGLPVYPPRAIISYGEKLEPHMRQEVEAVFGARAWEEYSSVENCAIATECQYGRLHVHPDFGILELIRADGKPAQPGEIGETVVTGFANRDQIFIRLQLGDLAAWAAEPCPCGRHQFPPLAELYGRLGDTVVLRDGRRIARLGLFGNLKGVSEGQLIQEAIDRFTLRVVPTADYSERDRKALRARVATRLGPDVQYVIEEVAEIPRERGGKKRTIVSLIHPELTGPVVTGGDIPEIAAPVSSRR